MASSVSATLVFRSPSNSAHAGFHVTGFDVDETKNAAINAGRELATFRRAGADIAASVKAGKLRATSDMSKLADMDVIDICVPTPLRKTKDPDLSHGEGRRGRWAKTLKKGQPSSWNRRSPGDDRRSRSADARSQGFKAGEDFMLAFSPERVDPGNALHDQADSEGGRRARQGEHGSRVRALRRASSPAWCRSVRRVAEMVKLLENTFRVVNIGP